MEKIITFICVWLYNCKLISLKKIIYILLFFTLNISAQEKFKQVTTIEITANFFTTDNQSNIYAIKGNELFKYNKLGTLLYKYSNKNLGNIDYIDASNPLRILVFYKNFLQVVFLDNTLSPHGEPTSFDILGLPQVTLAATSYNSCVWLYNQQNFELIRFNQSFEKTQVTTNLNLVLNISLQPTQLLEYDNRLYLNNPQTGILIFDIYGTYYKTIPLKGIQHFQPIGDWVYYQTENKIMAYNIKTTEEKDFEIPKQDFINFRVEMDYLFIQTTDKILVYTAN